jgi:hypothetical protein
MVVYVYRSFAESALMIGLMVLSIQLNSHRYPQYQFASTASTPFDSQQSIVGPPALAKMAFYMYKNFAERAVLIALTLLSIE